MNDTPIPPELPSDALVIDLDLRNTGSKAELLAAFARALSFPDWFGANWDALADCLGDLSWLPASAYLLRLHGQPALPASELDLLDEILSEAADNWTETGTPFVVQWLPA